MRIGIYREIQKSIRDSAKRLLDDKIKALGLSDRYVSTDTEVRGSNGTLFIFGGLRTNPDAIKSTEGLDLAIVMEANRVSKRSWKLLIPTVRNPGSEIWAEWNPENASDPVDEMFRGKDGPPPGSIVRQVNYYDNPFFPEVLRREAEYDRKRDEETFEHIWAGGYVKNSEARVFRNWRTKEFDTPADAVLRFGADWGFAVDPSVLIRMFIGRWEGEKVVADINGRCLFIDHEAYKVGCEIDETPSLFAGSDPKKRWENPHAHPGVPGAMSWLITADSARPETVSYMKRRGFRIRSAIKGPGSIEDGIEFLKTFDIYIHPRCRHAITEFTRYSWKTDELTGEILPILADKDNNVIDAARYACEGVRRAQKPVQAPEEAAKPADYRSNRREREWSMR